jgi:uncharacterized integral membrane protein (TIGR00698 family)
MLEKWVAGMPNGKTSRTLQEVGLLAPGLLISATIAMAAMFLSEHYGAPVMLLALLLGIAFNFLSFDGRCKAGINFTSRTVLRLGVGLLGVRITLEEILKLGPTPLILACAGVATTLACGVVVARLFGFNRNFGILTGGAVGICGASAALAIASVLPRNGEDGVSERDTIFTVLGVTTLSTIAMVVYPIIAHSFRLDDVSTGMFIGATIHDVAQVVGAGYTVSPAAGDAATLTKLLRVAMLVPVVISITMLVVRTGSAAGGRPPFPMFLAAFVALVLINSLGLVPKPAAAALSNVSQGAMVMAISALGMKTVLKDLFEVGPKALGLLVIETVWIAALGLVIITLG